MKRRDFITKSGTAATSLCVADVFKLYTAILAGTIQQANAQTTQTIGRRYLNLHMYGGPGRWTFDQWLTPNASDLTLNPGQTNWNEAVATGFSGGAPVYQLMTYKGLRIPIMFSGNVNVSAGNRPLTNLVDNMAVIRGYNSLLDGHDINSPLQLLPDPAVPSLQGLACDNRNEPMSAVSVNYAARPFKSGTGKSLFTINSGGPGGILSGLMRTFKPVSTSKRALATTDSAATVINQFHETVKTILTANFPRGAVTVDHLKSVKDLATYASDTLLTSQYASLKNKYTTIMNNAARDIINQTGFNGAAIKVDPNFSSVDGIAVNTSYDLRSAFTNATISDPMIDSLVLAEFCFTNNICGSLMLGNNQGMLENVSYLKAGGSTEITYQAGDQHGTSGRAASLGNATYYRGLSAGLIEIINVLKSQSDGNGLTKFDNTVIHLTGDFAREPFDGSGSNHGWQAQVTSVFSGAINTPIIVGNIQGQNKEYRTNGIWGDAAPVDFSGTKELLSPRHVAAAVAHLIGVANPWPFTPLVWQIDPTTKKLVPKVGAQII